MNKRFIGHLLFNIGFWTLFWGAFEFAYKCGVPIWSGTWGFPILHHYIVGAILCYVGYIFLCFEDAIVAELKKMQKDLEDLKVKVFQYPEE